MHHTKIERRKLLKGCTSSFFRRLLTACLVIIIHCRGSRTTWQPGSSAAPHHIASGQRSCGTSGDPRTGGEARGTRAAGTPRRYRSAILIYVVNKRVSSQYTQSIRLPCMTCMTKIIFPQDSTAPKDRRECQGLAAHQELLGSEGRVED